MPLAKRVRAATVDGMTRRAFSWLWLNLIPVLAITGTITFIAGATALTGLILAHLLGTAVGIASAATVAGGLTTAAAIRASRMVVISDGGRSQ